jgi:hypothetical protein
MVEEAGSGLARPGACAPGLSVYSEDVGAEICRAVEVGRSLRSVCAEPGRPHRATVQAWARSHPDFGEALRAAYRQARVSERMRDRQKAAMQAALPAPLRGGKASGYTRALGEAVCARLEAGESLTSIGRDPDMPCYGTVLKWVKRHPEFEEMYVAARQTQGHWLFDEARDVALGATRETVPVARLQFDVIRWQAARLAPKKYLERLVAAEARDEAAEDSGPLEVVFSITRFEVGPNREVLAAPPRNAKEAQAWVEATGRPYEAGVGPNGRIRPPMASPEDWARRDAYSERMAREWQGGRRRA